MHIEGPGVSRAMYRAIPWKRNSELKHIGEVDLTDITSQGNVIPGSVSITAMYDERTGWLQLLKTVCELMTADAAFVHVPAVAEMRREAPGYSHYYPDVRATLLKKQLSNLAWATFFGPPYIKDIDVAKVTDMGCRIEELAGGYLLLLSDDIMDSFNDFPTFSRRRVELKKQFRPDLFRITEEATDLICYVSKEPSEIDADIEALRATCPEFSDKRFLIYAPGEASVQHKDLAQDYGFNAKATFLVRLNDRSDTDRIVAVADILRQALGKENILILHGKSRRI